MATEVNEQITFSPTKNEKIKKQLLKEKTQRLRAGLPVYDAADIRRYRLPYDQAIIADLKDAGYENSAYFIEQLIMLEEETRNKQGPDSTILTKPKLVDSRKELDILSKGLGTAERAHNTHDFAKEYDEMIILSVRYAFGRTDDWWWLGEQLLFQCILMDYSGNFQKQRATCSYILGKYLLEHAHKADTARYYLDIARDISKNKSWNCKKLLGQDQDIIFIECCNLLHEALHEQAQVVMKIDPIAAADIYSLARKRAAEACNFAAEFKSLIEKGKCELHLPDANTAIATFIRALTHMTRRKCPEGICEARIQLALAYLKHGKYKEALECLGILKELADKYNMPFYMAQAYKYTGEHYLNQGQAKLATPLLIIAFFIFHKHNYLTYREEVRTLAAMSAGEELFPAYVELITSCDATERGRNRLSTLLKWKDARAIFWTTDQSNFKFPTEDQYDDIIPLKAPAQNLDEEEEEHEVVMHIEHSQNESIGSDVVNQDE